MSNLTTKSVKKSLDISDIINKAAENFNWNAKEKKKAYEAYIRHWYLCLKYPNELIAAIDKDADELWHQHIIDTRKYATDCQLIAGRFLNHTPIYGRPNKVERLLYNKTIKLYKKEFPNVDLKVSMGPTSGDYSYRDPSKEK